MHLLDSISTSRPVSTAKRRPRARRAEPGAANETAEFKPFRAGRDRRAPIAGAAIFAAGAGLALFDQILRGGPDGGEPVFAGCLRQRLALAPPTPARRCRGCARTRPPCATPSIFRAAARPARPVGCIALFRLYASLPARVDAAARAAELLGLRRRSTPARSPPLPPRRPTRSWPRRGPAPPR